MEHKIAQTPTISPSSSWVGFGLLISGALLLWFWLNPSAGENWWASFILLPVVALLGLTSLMQPRNPFVANLFKSVALLIAVVAGMFLFALSWAIWWPLMLICSGAGVLYMGTITVAHSPVSRAFAGASRWLGFTILLLGGTFQLGMLGVITLSETAPFYHWWSGFIALFGAGLAWQALQLQKAIGRSATTMSFYTFAGWALLTAVLEGIGYNWDQWQLLIGAILITFGLAQILTNHSK